MSDWQKGSVSGLATEGLSDARKQLWLRRSQSLVCRNQKWDFSALPHCRPWLEAVALGWGSGWGSRLGLRQGSLNLWGCLLCPPLPVPTLLFRWGWSRRTAAAGPLLLWRWGALIKVTVLTFIITHAPLLHREIPTPVLSWGGEHILREKPKNYCSWRCPALPDAESDSCSTFGSKISRT